MNLLQISITAWWLWASPSFRHISGLITAQWGVRWRAAKEDLIKDNQLKRRESEWRERRWSADSRKCCRRFFAARCRNFKYSLVWCDSRRLSAPRGVWITRVSSSHFMACGNKLNTHPRHSASFNIQTEYQISSHCRSRSHTNPKMRARVFAAWVKFALWDTKKSTCRNIFVYLPSSKLSDASIHN